jgi:hypothetical protein
MLPSTPSLATASSSQNRRTLFSTSQQRTGADVPSASAGATPTTGVEPPSLLLEDCVSVQDLLTFFSTSSFPTSAACDRGSSSVQAAWTACRRQVPLHLLDVWESSEMKQTRRVVAAYLADIIAKWPSAAGTYPSSPAGFVVAAAAAATMERFFLFLVASEQDVLRAVRQRNRVAPVDDAVSEKRLRGQMHVVGFHREEIRKGGAVERAALTYLTCCAAFLVLQGRQQSLAVGKGSDASAFAAAGIASSGGGGVCGCTALSLLRHTTVNRVTDAVTDNTPYWCSTGCEGLDRALGGAGFRSGWVTEIYGEAGAGKTQLGLQCLLEQSARDLCRTAVAVCLAHDPRFAALLGHSCSGGVAQRCRSVFGVAAVDTERCAMVFVVSEDVPTSRLSPLAAAAVRRAIRATQMHSLLSQLPSAIMEAVLRSVRQTCTVTMVLSRLQIRHVASLQEVLRLVEPTTTTAAAAATGRMSNDEPPPRGSHTCCLSEVVRMVGGAQGRALVVLDSIAGAAVGGQSDVSGAVHGDAPVAVVATALRRATAQHNWCVLVTNQVRAVPTAVRTIPRGFVPCRRRKRARSPTAAPSPLSWCGSSSPAVVPALGLAWASVAQCRVYLRKSLSLGVRQLVLRQSPAHPPCQVSYVITQDGIDDA